MPKFVHLHTHSHYSLLDGLAKIDDLVARAKELGMDALALTDHGVLYGAVEFFKKARAAGIKPILGVEAYVAPRDRFSKEPGERYNHLILLCESLAGWKNLLQLVTKAHLEGFYYKPRIDKDLLREHREGLIGLSACLGGEINQALLRDRLEDAKRLALEYEDIFGKGNFYLEIGDHPHIPDSVKARDRIIRLSQETGIPLAATQDIHYVHPEDATYHDILVAVQTGSRLTDDDRLTLKADDFSMTSPEMMAEKFKDVPEAVANTVMIAERCNVELDLKTIHLPHFPKPGGKTSNEYLKELVGERVPSRFPEGKLSAEVRDRLEYELDVITKTGFADYFLIVQDLVTWAKTHGIAVGPGRGSAAGSLVSYILGITDVNPLDYGLLFERFLNPERIQMPDIDIDFADRRRDEVLAYGREKYGGDRVAQIITFGTMAARAGIRDAGRALGLSYGFCDQIAKLIPFSFTIEESLEKVPELKALYDENKDAKRVLDSARHLEGVARHASVHACGTVFSEEPLVSYVPLQFAPQDKNTIITQFEMHSIEDLGLLKMDLLGLKNLTIIEDAIRLVRELKSEEVRISELPLDDKKTFELLREGDTTGVFQFECLSGDTLISNTTLQKLYERKHKNKLESVYVDEGKVHKNNILGVVKSGTKDTYMLIAENGWYIKATEGHNFMTDAGWKKLSDLKPGDKVLMKTKARHLTYNTCRTCEKQIDGQKDGRSKFCYTCSAGFYKNPRKETSRAKMKSARVKFFKKGGAVWNVGVTTQNNEIWRKTAEKISAALAGVSLQTRYGREKAALMKERVSKRFSGSGNPMFGKPSPHRKGGVRDDLGHYVRSNWEADFARILKLYGFEYEYEPKTFALRTPQGEIIHYTPDFYVKSHNTFYEVKGWLHDLDKKKMELFEAQYPEYNFVLINKTKFAELALQYQKLIRWECPRIPAAQSFKFLAVKEIQYAGKEETYDIAMEAPGNNFVANGFVVHNSSGMRRYMKEIKPTHFEDLVALVALFRPGPMELIPSFIKRKHGKERITYLHPRLEPILKTTYGIGVYQEQMMQIARDLAGYTLPEADTLRKAIGKKIKSLLGEQREKLVGGMLRNGIDKRTALAIWELFPPFARYGFNKCLTGETVVRDPETGLGVTLNEFAKDSRIIMKTHALNREQKLFENHIRKVHRNGKKPVWEVRTRSGRRITATANHPLLTPNGWRQLAEIRQGESVAVPRRIPEPNLPLPVERHKLAVLGYLLAEGNLCHPHSFYFYSKSEDEVKDYISHLTRFANTEATVDRSKPTVAVYARRKNLKLPSEAVVWINSLGLRNKNAVNKIVPDIAYRLANKDLAILIAKMFQGDGCIHFSDAGKVPQVFYATSSKKLAEGLQHLLLRLEVLSTIHQKKFRYRGGFKLGYAVYISRYDNLKKFLTKTSAHLVGEKKKAAKTILREHPIINGQHKDWSARGSKDTVPASLALPVLHQAVSAQNLTSSQAARDFGFAERLLYQDERKNGFLRETLGYISIKLQDDGLRDLAQSDIFWDEIVSIEPRGVEETYDLEMAGEHNFIANDIFVHNSHAVCYALIGYRTAYLKAHYPVEFMAGLLNAEVNDIDRIAFLVMEARQHSLKILAPDVNKSFVNFTPEESGIRFGLLAIKNVGEHITQIIIEERSARGPFQGVSDFLSRVQGKDLNKKSLESLIKCGVFDSLGAERNQLLMNIEEMLRFNASARKTAGTNHQSLFGAHAPPATFVLKPAPPISAKEKLVWEKELLGFFLSDHPLNAHSEKIKESGAKPINEARLVSSERTSFRIAGLVAKVQKILTKTGQPMLFARLEDFSPQPIEVVVFNNTLEKTLHIWEENAVVLADGHMSFRNGEPKFICEGARRLEA